MRKKIIFVLGLAVVLQASADENLPTMNPELELGSLISSVYGPVWHGQYSNYLTTQDAGSFLLDYGPKQFRMDLTWTHVLTPNQRFKLSAQHFSESNTFDFMAYPTGTFIGQNSLGGEYEYAFSQPWLNVLNVKGYYFDTNNGDLQNYIFGSNGSSFIVQRDLTGGQGGGVSLGPRWQLWKGGELGLAANYDQVTFNTHNEPNKNSEGIGGTAEFSQHLSEPVSLALMATVRQPYQQYTASIHWDFYRNPNYELGLQLAASHISSDVLPASSENIVGMNLSFRWNGKTRISRENPVCFVGDNRCDLLDWVKRSAAYMPGVFVQMDQKIVPMAQ